VVYLKSGNGGKEKGYIYKEVGVSISH